MLLDVETILEQGGETVPTAFRMGSTEIAVREIIDRWLANDHSYFKIQGDDDAVYILRHDKLARNWELTLFQRSGSN